MVTRMKVLFVGSLVFAFVAVGAGLLFAQKASKPQTAVKTEAIQEVKKAEAQKFLWGMERLNEAKDISPENIETIKGLIDNGGLFFNANEMREIVGGNGGDVAACSSDCNWCCCNASGRNCRCC